MTHAPRLLVTPSLITVIFASACGGAVGEVVRPDAPTAAEAVGERLVCNARGEATTPLVVDWPAQHRLDLEAAMKSGVVVIRYDCDQIEVISACTLEGRYEFVGVTLKEDVVRIESRDQLAANLPVGVATLGGSLDSQSSIHLAMALVGKTTAGWSQVHASDLPAACQGATHVVRSATLGAFSMGRGSKGESMSAAEVFQMGVSASSSSTKDSLSKDGSLDACRKGSPEDTAPPAQCGAAIRLELQPIAPDDATSDAGSSTPTESQIAPTVACPDGMAEANGVCAPKDAGAYTCDVGDEAECRAQCDLGSVESCHRAGLLIADFLFEVGPMGVIAQQDEAKGLFRKACDGGVPEACLSLGDLVVGTGSIGFDERRAAWTKADRLYDGACRRGVARACLLRALARRKDGPLADPALAFVFARRACALGSGTGCATLADNYLQGFGVPQDRDAAFQVLDRSCHAGDRLSCSRLAVTAYVGHYHFTSPTIPGLEKNIEKGDRYAIRACKLEKSQCAWPERWFKHDKSGLARFNETIVCKHGPARDCKTR